MLQSMGSQRIRHYWVTEQQQGTRSHMPHSAAKKSKEIKSRHCQTASKKAAEMYVFL